MDDIVTQLPDHPHSPGKRRRVDSKASTDPEDGKGSKVSESEQTSGKSASSTAKKCVRPSALWDSTKKDIFFEGLNEFGKDFEKVQQYFNSKMKRIYGNMEMDHVLKREQVRDFYSSTLKKVGAIVDLKSIHNLLRNEGILEEGRIKEYREVLSMLCYWQVMKQAKRMKWLPDKLNRKINELIFHGSTLLRIKSRNFFVRRHTPKYFTYWRCGRVPSEVVVDLLPFNNWSWGIVQNISQNPRVRLKISAKKSVADVVSLLEKKWDPAPERTVFDQLKLFLRAPSPGKYKKPFLSQKLADIQAAEKGKQRLTRSKKRTQSFGGTADEGNHMENSALPGGEEENRISFAEDAMQPSAEEQRDVTEAEIAEIIDQVEPEEGAAAAATDAAVVSDDEGWETGRSRARRPYKRRKRFKWSTYYSNKVAKDVKPFFGEEELEEEALVAEREELMVLDYWDTDTPSVLTIGYVYFKLGGSLPEKDFHLEYEWRLADSLDRGGINSSHNTLSLKRLCSLGTSEFQRIAKLGKFRDLFVTLKMEKWLSLPANSKSTESQTDLTIAKTQMVNASVQVGRDKTSTVPQPSKINGFLSVVGPENPAPTVPKTAATSPFILPKRPAVKRIGGAQRKLLPRPILPANTTQLIVSRNLGGITSKIEVAPYTRAETPIQATETPMKQRVVLPKPPPSSTLPPSPLHPPIQAAANEGFYVEYTTGFDTEIRWPVSPCPSNPGSGINLNSLLLEPDHDQQSQDSGSAAAKSFLDQLRFE